MDMDVFFQKVRTYGSLSPEAQVEWANLLHEKTYPKGSDFIRIGQIPRRVAFVVKGLFSQSFISDNGDTIIKYFFPEGRMAGSLPATITRSESMFAITALEDTDVLEYDFHEFKKLVLQHTDVAAFYIRYLEQHWIVEKEPYEISLRYDEAKTRYEEFLARYPQLVGRLKKHHIAAYLGITPTQLSRIFFANK
ncbi:MAG TPA: Crp/Fnr family transcriptional regulator [Puia sp.]|jgi:CRP-like cAMP-binding protein